MIRRLARIIDSNKTSIIIRQKLQKGRRNALANMWLIHCRVMPFGSLGWQRSVVTLHASLHGIRKFTISCDKLSHFAARNITLNYAHNFYQMSKCWFIPTMTNFPANSTCPNLSFSKEIFYNAIIYDFNSMFSINKFYNIFCSNSMPSIIIRNFCIV